MTREDYETAHMVHYLH